MNNLNQLYSNTFYLYEYIPSRYWNICSEEQYRETQRILTYKNYAESKRREDRPVFVNYTFDLMDALSEISKKYLRRPKGLVLIAIPRSIPNKTSTMMESIGMISALSEQGVAKSNSQCETPLIDASKLIVRTKPLPPAHLSAEAREYVNQKNSMQVTTRERLKNDVGYVLMDDIITSGTQMSVCKALLQERGVAKHNIVQLAIGKTITL